MDNVVDKIGEYVKELITVFQKRWKYYACFGGIGSIVGWLSKGAFGRTLVALMLIDILIFCIIHIRLKEHGVSSLSERYSPEFIKAINELQEKMKEREGEN